MNFSFVQITSKKNWENFNLSFTNPSLFQSWNFGESLKKIGKEIWRFGFYKKNMLSGIVQIENVKAKRGRFMHIRGGPVLRDWNDFTLFFPALRSFAQKKGAYFIRISPPIPVIDSSSTKIITDLGFRDVPIPLLDAEVAWVLDVSPKPELLLSQMRKTTRYMIKKAQKMGVLIKKSTETKAIERLLELYKIMVVEKKIVPHEGIKEEFKEFIKDNQALIISGYFKNKLMGSALILFYGNEGIYHHSAHLRTTEKVPVSYLMQWEAILETQKRNKKIYNFWGIEPTGNPAHPWFGLSLFKKGFGGYERRYIRAKDYPLSPIYRLTWGIETLRRISRYKTV